MCVKTQHASIGLMCVPVRVIEMDRERENTIHVVKVITKFASKLPCLIDCYLLPPAAVHDVS